ncbi:diacylglycerol kinase [Ignatzschineria rhizosphaerae]|uniref:Diacylglycerol kinase n=1 Tax=Ignatzschineria rhizosphaerae TaxID=2923279 RepID=A0ABY3X1X0_9GAMM|nr:diacylglycerol kinase [Ignatzschineria rhizosphaerae]UNM96866.1 diacylglycerol kinase [Ignatzschineria rhizosphaerae]
MSEKMNKPGKKGFARIIAATGYSWQGLKAAYRNEAAIRQELLAGIVVIPLAIYLAKTGVELALLVGSALLVFLMELINSAIEAIVDRIGAEYHPLSGQAKDIGSALVMVAMIIAAIVWGAILFYPT